MCAAHDLFCSTKKKKKEEDEHSPMEWDHGDSREEHYW